MLAQRVSAKLGNGMSSSPGGATLSFRVSAQRMRHSPAVAGSARQPIPRRPQPSSITFNVGPPTFLPVLLAKPRSIPTQQLATSPDLIRNHAARILVSASFAVPRCHLPALPLQFIRSLLPDRTIASPSVPIPSAMSFAAPYRHKIRPASMVHPDSSFVGSPRVSFLTSRTAPLLRQLHAATCVRLAVVSSPIIRSAVK